MNKFARIVQDLNSLIIFSHLLLQKSTSTWYKEVGKNFYTLDSNHKVKKQEANGTLCWENWIIRNEGSKSLNFLHIIYTTSTSLWNCESENCVSACDNFIQGR